MSKAADAVYPHLAVKDAELPKPLADYRPKWGTSNNHLWNEPRSIPNGLDRVPGLVKSANRR
jgi:hypothetical protein